VRPFGWILVVLAGLTALVALGRRPAVVGPDPHAIDAIVPRDPADLDAWLAAREHAAGDVIDGTASHIRWHGQPGTRTPLTLVSLHGFSASPRELHPVLEQVADDLGANLVHVRLNGHGLQGGDMAEVSADAWLADAELGYQVGRRTGDRIVVVGTSTGAALALWLARRHQRDDALAGVTLTSPNLKVDNPLAELLLWPWGSRILSLAIPSRCGEHETDAQRHYWTVCYQTHGVVAMMDLLAAVRSLPPEEVDVPLRTIVNPDDGVIDAEYAMSWLDRAPDSEVTVWEVAPGDNGHVLAGDLKSPGGTERMRQMLRERIAGFLDD